MSVMLPSFRRRAALVASTLSLSLITTAPSAQESLPLGPLVMLVSGGTVSTVHALVAGVASTLPTRSRARAESV